MKKIAVIALLALVVVGCVFLAGCTQQQTTTVQQEVVEPATVTPAVTISLNDIHKDGLSYNVGDIAELRFPANSTTGYQWVVTQKDDGLDVKDSYIEDDHEEGMTGFGGTTVFWLSADKPGTYAFTMKYMQSWAGEESAIATYSDKMIVEEKPDAVSVDGPSLSIVFDTFNINPKAGETVLVKIRGNATTGFRWSASGDGLTVQEDYKVDDAPEGMTGVPGTFLYYVTAPKAGTYTLNISEGRAGSSDSSTIIAIPLTFQ